MKNRFLANLIESFESLQRNWDTRFGELVQSCSPLIDQSKRLNACLETNNTSFLKILSRYRDIELLLKKLPSDQEIQDWKKLKDTIMENTQRTNLYIEDMALLKMEYVSMRKEYQELRETLKQRL